MDTAREILGLVNAGRKEEAADLAKRQDEINEKLIQEFQEFEKRREASEAEEAKRRSNCYNGLDKYSTTQLKAELRRRKRR